MLTPVRPYEYEIRSDRIGSAARVVPRKWRDTVAVVGLPNREAGRQTVRDREVVYSSHTSSETDSAVF
eukprot:scaffold354211_cov46-Prasinocladus_malaysianus.AAC.1